MPQRQSRHGEQKISASGENQIPFLGHLAHSVGPILTEIHKESHKNCLTSIPQSLTTL